MEGSRTQLRDYRKYQLQGKELLFYSIAGFVMIGILSLVFYHSWIATIILSPIIVLYLQEKERELGKKQRKELNEQFKEAIMAVAVGLRAGYSVENAFRATNADMRVMFGAESNICKELSYIESALDSNVRLENLLESLARRSGSEDIYDFAQIFQIAKRNGGDMNRIIQSCVSTIGGKIEINKEIQTLICAKQLEQKIMNLVPILIILYIQSTSPGFFNPLYHNLAGIVIMSICLLLYAAAYYLAKKITDIQI